jgi:hypothetical protein
LQRLSLVGFSGYPRTKTHHYKAQNTRNAPQMSKIKKEIAKLSLQKTGSSLA